jgi:hypothetical protein
MNVLAEAIRENTNKAFTKNGALSNDSTLNGVLDFFSKSGALRGQDDKAVKYFTRALAEDETLAMKALFYARDIRGGQGERSIFRNIISYMAMFHKDVIKRNLSLIPEFGRWDDIFVLFGTDLEKDALELIKSQFDADLKSDSPSVLAKWMKSSNTSSAESRKLAKKTYTYFNITEREYRKKVSALRKKIGIVEQKMSAKNFKEIDYSHVPSQAARIYAKSFLKRDEERYSKFIEKVENGEAKINAGTLYPYQIVSGIEFKANKEKKALNVLWNALPDYAEEPENSLCVVDVSGSMTMGYSNVTPIDVSVSLGIYFAERMKGAFNGYFMTFSDEPKMQKIQGKTIAEKVSNLKKADWEYNTNIIAVFDTLLKTAIKKHVPQKDMPNKIYIISDMQFDEAVKGGESVRNFDAIKSTYDLAGYEMPSLVFWNVNASSDTPVTKAERGTYLVSGCSPSILKYAVNCEAVTPYELMLEVLESERYSQVK